MNRPVSAKTIRHGTLKIEAFIDTQDAKAAIELVQRQIGSGGQVQYHSGTLATAARLAGMTSLGDILVAELGADDKAVNLGLINDLLAEGLQLILLGRQNDIDTYRSYINAGVYEYLALPVEPDAQVKFERREQPTAQASTFASARTIGICGVTGGVGASALATNLAVSYLDLTRSGKLARDNLGRVALLDADLHFGSLAVDLDIETTPGLLEALLAPERVDSTFLNATMSSPLEGLSVYSAETTEPGRLQNYEAGFPALLEQIKAAQPTVIVDLPRRLLLQHPETAESLDELVLLVGQGFGSIRSCSRLLHRLADQAQAPRMTCVLSQTRRDAGLRKSEISTALNREIALTLPYCATDLARASIKGKPLQKLSARSKYGRTISKLAVHLERPSQTPTASKRRFWPKKQAMSHV
ncbi:CpaE family protein [Sulfitobacter sp. 1A10445]|uniref:AAA family ATPase n=1 Tax=unclassified Sulfitobacter TaxID=196795 RepID=UPI0037470F25